MDLLSLLADGNSYHQATDSLSSAASSASVTASPYATDAASFAADASSAVRVAASSVSSAARYASSVAVNAPHDASDFVYSTWDDNTLRKYLEDKKIIKTKTTLKREEYLDLIRKPVDALTPPYELWSDSYIVRRFPSHPRSFAGR